MNFKDVIMNKSLLDLGNELRKKNKTDNNTFTQFPVKTRIKVISLCVDFSFFYGETGVVIENFGRYLGIIVEFDTPRKYRNGTVQKTFNFNPKDLKIINDKPIKEEIKMKETKKSLIPYFKKISLSEKEEWREYQFPGGDIIHIDNPQFLIISDNGHRIGCNEMSHYIPYGWLALTWLNKSDRTQNFYCEKPDEEQSTGQEKN